MADSPHVFDVDDATFDEKVMERSNQVPVVIDFWAPWCAPCRTLAPVLERLVNARNGEVVLAKVNVDENPELASAFRIEGIPAVKAIRNGQLVLQFEGLLPEAQLNDFLDRLLPTAEDREAARAKSLEASDPTEAAGIYAQLLAKESTHPGALLGSARLKLAEGAYDAAESLLELVPPGGDDGAEADRIRSAAALRRVSGNVGELARHAAANADNAEARFEYGQALAAANKYPEALAELYAAAELDRDLARGKVKDLMVKIFGVIGQRSDLAEEFRDKLQRVMY